MIKFIVIVTLTVVTLMHICIVLPAESEHETDNDQDSLKVEILDRPPSCATSSQRGNILKLHYTGYLLDGEKFDSRLVKRQCFKTIIRAVLRAGAKLEQLEPKKARAFIVRLKCSNQEYLREDFHNGPTEKMQFNRHK